MVSALQSLLGLYLTFKLVQFFFAGRPVVARTELTVREKLLRGEPVVFLVAFAIAVPAALGTTWYFTRGYERGFARSADCYGRLTALSSLPALYQRFDGLDVYRTTQLSRTMASNTGKWLEMDPHSIEQVLSTKLRTYTRRYASLSRQPDRIVAGDDFRAVDFCMHKPFILF